MTIVQEDSSNHTEGNTAPAVDLWQSRTDRPADYYRIPALAVTNNGTLLAISDVRYGNNSDLGNGHRIDLVMKRSLDNGKTWSKEQKITHTPLNAQTGYGDAAVVADRTSNDVLLLCAHGNISYQAGSKENHQHIIKLTSNDGGNTFTQPQDISADIFKYNTAWESLFFASGRIMQSRFIRVKKHYRIYSALLSKNYGNAVMYSDDFGDSWKVLGNPAISPIPDGDEAKTEELPDGSILLSSRKDGGRLFNIFTYSDPYAGCGSWGTPVFCALGECRGTNGEVLVVKARKAETRKPVYLLLQSLPAVEGRKNITIYWRELDKEPISPLQLCNKTRWSTAAQEKTTRMPYLVDEDFGAYSTMLIQKDGHIGFLYESHTRGYAPDGEKFEYDIRYKCLSISEITGRQYEMIFVGTGSKDCPYAAPDGTAAAIIDLAYFDTEKFYRVTEYR